MAKHIEAVTVTATDVNPTPTDLDSIARLAYALWQERGCPEGSPGEDWYRAEREIASTAYDGEPA